MTHHAHPTVSAKPLSRRTMLKALAASSVAVSAGSIIAGSAASAAAGPVQAGATTPLASGSRLVPTNRIGIQMYTVRDKVQSEGFRAVFEELADIGYSEIEFAGYGQGTGDISIAEIRQLLDDNGLRAVGAHVTLTPESIDKEIENALALGMPFVGQGGPITRGTTKAEWQQAAQTWAEMGEKARGAGLGLYMHNHSGEFQFHVGRPEHARLRPALGGPEGHERDLRDGRVLGVRRPAPVPRVPADRLCQGRSPPVPADAPQGRQAQPRSGNGYDIIEFGAGDIPYQQFLTQLKSFRGRRYGMYEQDNAANVAEPGNDLNSLGNARRSYQQIAALRG